MSLSYNYPPQYAYPSAPPVYRAFPAPPRLHWAWVLLLSILTFGIFWMVWMVVQARWVKKATGNARPFGWALAYLLYIPVIVLAAAAGAVILTFTSRSGMIPDFSNHVADLARVFSFLLYIASVYMLKSALESPLIRIPLHGLATFFFGPVYFQYYLQNYKVEGKVGEQLSGFAEGAGEGGTAAAEAAQASQQP
jgi:hypothetical protein